MDQKRLLVVGTEDIEVIIGAALEAGFYCDFGRDHASTLEEALRLQSERKYEVVVTSAYLELFRDFCVDPAYGTPLTIMFAGFGEDAINYVETFGVVYVYSGDRGSLIDVLRKENRQA